MAVAACVDGLCGNKWVAAGCMPIADPDVVTTRPCLHACYPRILLMLDQEGTARATGVSTLYIHGLCQRLGCDYGNQLYVSFGLAYRYLILMGTKCYRVL